MVGFETPLFVRRYHFSHDIVKLNVIKYSIEERDFEKFDIKMFEKKFCFSINLMQNLFECKT